LTSNTSFCVIGTVRQSSFWNIFSLLSTNLSVSKTEWEVLGSAFLEVNTFSQAFFTSLETILGMLLVVLTTFVVPSLSFFVCLYSTAHSCWLLNTLSGCALAKNLPGLSHLLSLIAPTLSSMNLWVIFLCNFDKFSLTTCIVCW